MLYTLINDFNDVPELTGDVLSGGLLTAEETTIFQSLKTEKRRRDWLNGRYTAKRLIQQVFRAEKNRQLDDTDFAILRKETGAPALSWLNGNGRYPLTLSISHAGDLAFCAVSLEANTPLGCDVEQIAPRSDSFIADYFTSEEQTLIEQAPASQRDALVNAVWSGKEAALKALELGLRVDTRAVTCLPEPGRAQGWRPLTITFDPTRLPTPAPPLSGQWRLQGGYVITITTTYLNESLRFFAPPRLFISHPYKERIE
jgi:4'-phosphopantetheinyl transferase